MATDTPQQPTSDRAGRPSIGPIRRVVVKIGSAQLTDPDAGLAFGRIQRWAKQIRSLAEAGTQVLLVSSGAVAEGCRRLGLAARPQSMHELQAAAAIGQVGLIQAYESAFADQDMATALVLLTWEDLADRQRYLNARSTLQSLWDMGVVPVINENDTVATDEIRFGDNDTLAALVANLLQADMLVILTDQGGLYTADPRLNADAELISHAEVDEARLDQFAGAGGGEFGRGGMETKLRAARLAARSGAHTLIAKGDAEDVLLRAVRTQDVGTLLTTVYKPMDARKRWIADQLQIKGTLTVDPGAAQALTTQGVSLLPVGVHAVEGQFTRGDLVQVVGAEGKPLAQGLVNYSSDEVAQLAGHASSSIVERIGYCNEEELIHRDNLVLL